jgi:hypothetical protein
VASPVILVGVGLPDVRFRNAPSKFAPTGHPHNSTEQHREEDLRKSPVAPDLAELAADASPSLATDDAPPLPDDSGHSGVAEDDWTLQCAVAADEADPVSGVREKFAGSLDIEQVFWEAAQR